MFSQCGLAPAEESIHSSRFLIVPTKALFEVCYGHNLSTLHAGSFCNWRGVAQSSSYHLRLQFRSCCGQAKIIVSQADPISFEQLNHKLLEIVQGIFANSIDLQIQAISGFRKLLSKEHDPPFIHTFEAGVTNRVVELLRSSNARLQFEAA
jgi:hypothetical protein